MLCPGCRADNPPRAKFCVECASPLAPGCPDCGSPLPATARFCPGCARPLAAVGLRLAPPGAYTPPHLAEKIRAGRRALEGERKRVSVLFADIAGSMHLMLDRDPEDARVVLDGVIERMMEAVHASEGTVNQILGDGIMALFGAPVAHEDHAVRACHAALRMQDLVGRFAAGIRASTGMEVRIRVGIHCGDVLVRSIANDLHMDYTAVGQTTHLAARMEQMASPGEILATREVLHLVEGYVQARALGPRAVKGLAQPVELFAVTGAEPARTRFEVSVQRGLGRFIGRETELARLDGARQAAHAGRGRLVGVVGEPGVGKSRLLWEFTRAARQRGCTVLEATSIARDRNVSYLPLAELLGRYFGIGDADDGEAAAAKIVRRVHSVDESIAPPLAPLLAVFNRPVEDPNWLQLDPPQRHLRIIDAVKTVLLRQAAAEPTIVLVADLHWVDAETQSVLDSLAGSLDDARLLVLAEFRPGYRHKWEGQACWSELRVVPLPEANALALFRALVSPEPALAPLERLVLARTAGNPFFLEETVRALVETGILQGTPGGYRLVRALDSVEIPATVHDVLAARIDRLAPRERTLLQLAAVIGAEVPRDVLAHTAGLDAGSLEAALARLESAGLLAGTDAGAGTRLAFKHAFTHEVTLSSLLQQQRRALHVMILEAIESLHPARTEEYVDSLAHHALHGEQWLTAVQYLRRAAAQATARSAYRSAVELLEQAVQALGHVAADAGTAGIEIDLRLEMRAPLLALGMFERMLAVLRGAEAIASVRGDPVSRARVAVYVTGHLWLVGENAAAVHAEPRTLALIEPLGDPALMVPARFYLGASRHALGDFRQSAHLLEANLAEIARHGNHRFGLTGLPAVLCRGIRVLSNTELGNFDAADSEAAETLRIAEASGHPFSTITAHYVAAGARLARGDHDGTLALVKRGMDIGRSEDVPLYYLPLLTLQAEALTRNDGAAQAAKITERILSLRREPINVATHAAMAPACAYLLAGRHADAAAFAQAGLETAKRKRERSFEAWALRALAEVETARDPLRQLGTAYLAQALAQARELGMRPLEARCQFDLGLLLLGQDRTAARAPLAEAATIFEQAGMPFWLARARAAQAQA